MNDAPNDAPTYSRLTLAAFVKLAAAELAAHDNRTAEHVAAVHLARAALAFQVQSDLRDHAWEQRQAEILVEASGD